MLSSISSIDFSAGSIHDSSSGISSISLSDLSSSVQLFSSSVVNIISSSPSLYRDVFTGPSPAIPGPQSPVRHRS